MPTTIVSPPTGLLYGTFEMGIRRFDLTEMSDTTGDIKDRLVAPPRWTVQMGPPSPASQLQLSLWRGLISSLNGSINVLALPLPIQAVPRGAARGSIGVGGAAGAVSISPSGLEIGDYVQLGSGLSSQLVMLSTAAGSIGSPLRAAYGSGMVEYPLLHCKMVSASPSWTWQAGASLGVGGGAIIDLMEYWEY